MALSEFHQVVAFFLEERPVNVPKFSCIFTAASHGYGHSLREPNANKHPFWLSVSLAMQSDIIIHHLISDHFWSYLIILGLKYLKSSEISNYSTSTICGICIYIYCICDFRPSKTFVHKSTWSPTSPLRSKVELKWRALAVFAASPLFVCAQIQGNPLLGWDGQRSKPGCEMIWTNWAWKLYRYLSYLYVVIWLICGYPWISDISVRL